MAEPDRTVYQQPSVRQCTTWTPPLVRLIKAQADSGQLQRIADLCDDMLSDDRILGVLSTLADSLLGVNLGFDDGARRGRRKKVTGEERSDVILALEDDGDWWELPEPVTVPAIPGKGRPEDKAEAGALTYCNGYVVLGLLQIEREDESSPNRRDDRDANPQERFQQRRDAAQATKSEATKQKAKPEPVSKRIEEAETPQALGELVVRSKDLAQIRALNAR